MSNKLDTLEGGTDLDMTHDEKVAWIRLATTTVTYASYVIIILARAGAAPLAETPYVRTLLTLIAISVVVTILASIIVAISSDKGARQHDQRDREIRRFGEYLGLSLFVLGGGAAMLLAMYEVAHFWIANVLFLTWCLSVIVGAIAKLIAYRKGFPGA